MAQPEIPPFGDWEITGNTPYTQKFEDARKNKKIGIPSNPNDPRQHPEPPRKSPLHPSAYKADPQNQGPRNPPHRTRPETDPHRYTEHPTHRELAPRRHANPQKEQGGNASAPRSPYRAAAGSASPMQANNQSRSKHRSTGMQTPERRTSLEGHGQHTPGRSRMKQSGRGYEPEEEVAVPPFGDWDEANAASGEKYTGIFNRVRNDKLSPNTSARLPSTATGGQENKVKQTCPCCIL
ncbi:RPM1-interacting protein 4-like [Phragmites australis]|uniref:RPM1-interacting protein 4-like n=1 Tax=Phragmites australis TaxID=29695 RepID=UPI002D76D636|nr:RPM1-interacting protein 4-like [Phragmites australis]